jgi:formylglycine-generating enzyme required for sulfatase activity
MLDMIDLDGGIFEMGTSQEEVDQAMARYGIRHRDLFSAEVPRHTVRLSSFSMSVTPVTNAQFAEFIGAQPEWSPGRMDAKFHNGRYLEHWIHGTYPPGLADHPVVFVSWPAALAYARWIGGRLPTEAEWEFAARGGRASAEFPWGDRMPNPELACYGAQGTAPVASFPPNPYGLFDLAGNVWEYCLDEWLPDFYIHSPQENPWAGDLAFSEGRRVIRGGSWGGSPVNLRCAYRDSHPANGAGNHVGFRCVKDCKTG